MLHMARRSVLGKGLRLLIAAAVLFSTVIGMFQPMQVARAAALTPGNLVVYRVGNGSGSLVNTGNPVFLDEYTTSGIFVQSIPMPTSTIGANNALFASGTATSEGLLTISPNGQYITLTGYASTPGVSLSGTAAATVNRVIGIVDLSGTVDTTTNLPDFADSNNPRSAVTSNGTDIWMTGGAGGVRYTTRDGASSTQLSTALTNLRQVNIFDGQLYFSTSSGSTYRVGTAGTGLPTTSGQTLTNLPSFPTSGSPYGYYFADLSAAVDGLDTLYVADDGASGGQIQKYALVSGNWTSNGSVSATTVRGLSGTTSGTTVSLFGTTGGNGATGGGSI